jgi:hypothetical protein
MWRSARCSLTAAGLVFLAALTSLAQPGLCPCWLVADLEEFHPHPGGDDQAEFPHSHAYLHEIFQAQPAGMAPALVTARAFVAELTARTLWQRLLEGHAWSAGWGDRPEHPPPRAA